MALLNLKQHLHTTVSILNLFARDTPSYSESDRLRDRIFHFKVMITSNNQPFYY